MAIINSFIFPFLTCFIFILLAISTNQAVLDHPPKPFQYTLCSYEKGNFTNPSIYSTNLNGLLSSLPFGDSNAGGFYSWSYGENSGKVYATGVCRGDVKPDSCTACLSDATYLLKEACSNQKEATIWLDEKCILRYSNGSMYGVVQVLPSFYKWKSENVSWSDVDWFYQRLVMLLKSLTSEAAAGGDVRKFATGNASSPSTTSHHQTIYALVQCTPDLSEPECSSCLVSALGDVQFYGYRKEGGTVITPSCNLKYDVYPFFDSTIYEAASPLPVLPFFSFPPSTTTKKSRGKKSNRHRTAIIIVIVLIVVFLLLILSNICTFLRGRKAKKILEDLQMDFDEIKSATDDFSDTNKLGQGGFGVVYKGILRPNGEEIAVKRLSTQSGQGELEFNNELLTLAKLQHRNLVKLRGFCVEKRERLLVYEFVRNGSLDRYIFDSNKGSELNWDLRFKIIAGIGRGLLYLHEDSGHKIIHRDLKPSNILLDAKMDPKIADFGTARLFVVDQTQDNTDRIVGTFGYMAPEYFSNGHISVKSDVYSFGVLILEIVRGERINAVNFLSDVWKKWRQGTTASLIDTTLGLMRTDSTTEKMKRCIHIGLLCVQNSKEDRPTIGSVISMLTNDSVPLPTPSQPAFVTPNPVQLNGASSFFAKIKAFAGSFANLL